jgi:hypothetical protein
MTSNTFNSLKPDLKESYSDEKDKKKKKRFSRIKNLTQSKGKATAMSEASKDPMKFIQDTKNMSIKGLKGVAF